MVVPKPVASRPVEPLTVERCLCPVVFLPHVVPWPVDPLTVERCLGPEVVSRPVILVPVDLPDRGEVPEPLVSLL